MIGDRLDMPKVTAKKASSSFGGYQSEIIDVRKTPIFLGEVNNVIEQVTEDLSIIQGCQLIMESCWININYPGNLNLKHTHANSMLSGVYYISAPENCGRLVFIDPRPQANVLLFPVVRETEYTTKVLNRSPLAGEFIVFPSWLEHYVEENKSERERISVAFNIYFQQP